MDTLTGCKVDISHSTDCNSAQIFVEVLGVSIDPANPNELLGGETFPYAWTVTQGAQVINSPVKWAVTSDTSGGLDLTKFIDPLTGIVMVPPQSAFQGKDFFVDIQATSTIDPAVAFSAPFAIHIPTVSVQMTTAPSEGITFEAIPGTTVFNFAANVVGPDNPQNRVISSWASNFIPTFSDFVEPGMINFPDPSNLNAIEYVIIHAPRNTVSTTLVACVGGSIDLSTGGLRDGICARSRLNLAPPVIPLTPSPTINSGESTLVTIKGTGFGAAPVVTFTDPTVSFTPGPISGPDANGVTTVTGTITAAPVPPPIPFHLVTIPVTITSSLPPPSTPVNQNVSVWPVNVTPAVTPVNPTLLVSQSQQFTATLTCLTRGGQPCTVPQTSTCSLFTGVGTMSASCLYTAPASLAAQTQVQGKACFTFGNICTGFSFNLVPVTVKPLVTVLSGETPFTYFLTSGGHVYTVWCTTSGCAWDDPSGDANAPAADSGSALNVVSTANGLIAYYLTSNGHVIALNTSHGFSDTWQDMTAAGGNFAAAAGSPLVTVVSGQTPFTYFLTGNGHVITNWCTTSGCTWDDPSGGANAPAAASGSPLNVVATANGVIAYFLTLNGHVIALNTSNGFSDTWQDVTAAGGNFAAAAGSPLVTVVSGQTPFTYFLTGNGHVITNWCTTSGCTWDDPSGGANAPAAAAGSPLNVVATANGLIAYFLTSNRHVIALNTSHGFSDTWQDITSAAGAPAADIESSLTTVVSSNGSLITHFVIPEGHLVSISCTASGQCTSIDETANASAPPVAL